MKSILIAVISFVTFYSCAQTQNKNEIKNEKIPAGIKGSPSPNEALATFGQGCFWHSEIVFQSLVGVRDAVSGYAGGSDQNPNYENVCSGKTGHAEVVQVYYDPAKISYATLVSAFFSSMDPTTLNRQGNDRGTQYRSVAFYRNEKEKEILESEIRMLDNSKKYANKIVTEIKPFSKFYMAEDYHQEYVLNHPDNGYVKNVSIPDYMEFRKEFKGTFK